MKKVLLAGIFFALSPFCGAQNMIKSNPYSSKERIFIYWGYNRGQFSKTDIHFKGQEYNFTLKSVIAKDRPTPLSTLYINPTQITIPQYNFRIGYFINPKYSISFGFDHMKYVMEQDQTVTINGKIGASDSEYDRTYNNEPIKLSGNFLRFEHTNGLNYLNLELRRMDNILSRENLKIRHIDLNIFTGVGAGILYPKTDVSLLSFEENDQWHLAGYGLDVVGGLNLTFFKHFFIQAEVKGGYINMPDILTTNFPNDRASQHFFFLQENLNIGFVVKF